MGEILIKIYLDPYSLNAACSGPHESQLYKNAVSDFFTPTTGYVTWRQ